ncbi:unnamed protein product [Sphenostylis stenocarpa]|uniref:Uncharacterized protein n=1 Tax=Sphenostylis stenocarpa TaxID=92480 RepID=A0AA86VQ22_9FABA|nr:unnamed protein product [Sphenostylis stenocarpa]
MSNGMTGADIPDLDSFDDLGVFPSFNYVNIEASRMILHLPLDRYCKDMASRSLDIPCGASLGEKSFCHVFELSKRHVLSCCARGVSYNLHASTGGKTRGSYNRHPNVPEATRDGQCATVIRGSSRPTCVSYFASNSCREESYGFQSER